MADSFGLSFEGIRDKLEQSNEVLTSLVGTAEGASTGTLVLGLNTSETAGIPIPEDSTVMVVIFYSVSIEGTNPRYEAGRFFTAARRGSTSTVSLLERVGAADFITGVTFSSNAAATTPEANLTVSADNVNSALVLTVSAPGANNITYLYGSIQLICIKDGKEIPLYQGGAEANSPFGVS